MNQSSSSKRTADRRSFIKRSLTTAGVTGFGVGLVANSSALADEDQDAKLTKGDAAILRFLAAAEIIETDLWIQYNELGGVQDSEVPGVTGGSAPYMAALAKLDPDMSQYIHDNTEDEMSHFQFINAYLTSKGAEPVNLDHFKTIQGSKATGARQIGRLTNLMKLTVDTSFWSRYRSRANNPDLDPGFVFPQAVPSLAKGKFPAIPRDNNDLAPDKHIQAIANTAGFHFAFIEQGGSSLYPSLAQRVTNAEVLRILLSIGPTETAHFQTWHDKAGNAVPLTDPTNPNLVFPDLNKPPYPPPFGAEDFQTNLIMPEPCHFLNRTFPVCSIIRPTETRNAAMGAVKSLVADGLFADQQNAAFFQLLQELAHEADSAQRGGD